LYYNGRGRWGRGALETRAKLGNQIYVQYEDNFNITDITYVKEVIS
jgi:hypothetical protein